MKVDRHGQAKILTTEEIDLLFNEGLTNHRDRTIFAICLYTGCRIAECVSLRTTDVYYRQGIVRPEIVFRKGTTKGKLATRCIPVIEELRLTILNYYPSPRTWFFFPGLGQTGHLHPESASRILRRACNKVGIQGVSTHSFRRTALTLMSNEGIPLRIIQEISGHRNLEELQKYLEIKPEQVRGAVSALSMLSPVRKSCFPDTIQQESIQPGNNNSF
ncbi:MAG: tyrosine-type recombinase/integrase [Xenococcus sp. (in: cyanobacteria)]